ncbi:MAG: protein kinase [Steroidobacteraceae bacterium]
MTHGDVVGLRQDDDELTSELQTDEPTADLEAKAPPEPQIPHKEPIVTDTLSRDRAPAAAVAPAEPVHVPQKLESGPGTVLRERYLLQQVIGSGGTSMVYRAQDLRHEAGASSIRVIAVKLLREELREDARAIERLKREFTQMQLLAHPGVLKVFDLDVDRGVWFMTMEMLEGQSLSMYLRTHRTPHPNALELVKSCAESLEFAHERGIVHGDLKPGNIFLTSAGARILDFIGAADELRTDRAATPAYASPQRLAGELPEVSDDIYSLGCVAYELLAGVHPFDRKPATVAHQLGLQPARINSMSYREWRALDRALAFDRRDRHASMRTFLDALFHEETKAAPARVSRPGDPSVDGSATEAAQIVGIIPVAMPATALTMPPLSEADGAGESATAANDVSAAPAQADEAPLALREREILIQPFTDIEELKVTPLPPVFEPPRRNAVLPVVIALILAALGLYVTRSDLKLAASGSTTVDTAPAAAATPSDSRDTASSAPSTPAAAASFTPAPVDATDAPVVPQAVATDNQTARVSKGKALKTTAAAAAAKTPATVGKARASDVGFTTSRVSVSEKSVAAVIQVKRLGASTAGRIPVHWRTEKRSAKPGEDYKEVSTGTLLLQDGQRMGAIYVPINNDDLSESDEMFVVELVDSAASAAPDIGLAIVTIRDDDRVLLTSNP